MEVSAIGQTNAYLYTYVHACTYIYIYTYIYTYRYQDLNIYENAVMFKGAYRDIALEVLLR